MDKPIYDLVYSSWDWEKHYYFHGPNESTKEQFDEVCELLLPKAGYKAVQKQVYSEFGSWVTWQDVVESLVPLLQEQGYQLIQLPRVEINCNGIIGLNSRRHGMDRRLGFANKLIYDHNRALDEKIKQEVNDKKSRKGKSRKFLPQIMK